MPCGSIAGVGEAVSSEQAGARPMVIDAGGLPVPGQALKFSTYDDPASRPGRAANSTSTARRSSRGVAA